MQIKKIAIVSIAIATALGSATSSFAQGPAGGSQGGTATISGSEVRAGESRNLNTDQGVTTGSSNLRSIDRNTAVTPNGTVVDTTVAPGGLVGRDAPTAVEAAPAGR